MQQRFVAAVNPAARPIWKLAVLLAACPTVREAFAAATPAAAMERIYWPWAFDLADDDDPNQPQDRRPRIILEELQWESINPNDPYWRSSGSIALTIEMVVADESQYWPANFWPANFWPANFWPAPAVSVGDQYLAAMNVVGGLLGDLMRLKATEPTADDVPDPLGTTHLDLAYLRLIDPLGFVDARRKKGEYLVSAAYAVGWRN